MPAGPGHRKASFGRPFFWGRGTCRRHQDSRRFQALFRDWAPVAASIIAPMSHRPTLHTYIDEELLRAPMTLDIVIDEVLEQWRMRLPQRSRHDGDPARVLQQHRGDLVGAALGHLRSTAQAELAQRPGQPAPSASAPGKALRSNDLSLIDEDDVAVDIEIARCIEAVKIKAEFDLRTLQTYTSALVDDLNVSRDTNPFRPDRFVRALWAGVQVLPLSRPVMAAFLHEAAPPLAVGLQRTYQAAWMRLADQGVEPAAHRTIVAPGASMGGWGGTSARYRPPAGQDSLRGSLPSAATSTWSLALPSLPMPVVAADPAANLAAAGPAHRLDAGQTTLRSAVAPGLPAATDPQLIDLLSRLFDTIQQHFNLPPDTVALLQRLQPTALRLALRDPSVLDTYEHPLWRFMDHLVHDIQHSGASQRSRLVGLGRNLVDHLANGNTSEQQGFAWALERLLAAQRHALAQATAAAAPAIDKLQRRVRADATATTSTMPLDIASLDTVPAELMTEPATARPAASMLAADGLRAGTLVRAYLQGDWRTLLALWQDDGHELALLQEPTTDRLWALRQAALARLLAEGLAQPLRVRSLVRRAADRVLRGM